jgi:hypothetical protein
LGPATVATASAWLRSSAPRVLPKTQATETAPNASVCRRNAEALLLGLVRISHEPRSSTARTRQFR